MILNKYFLQIVPELYVRIILSVKQNHTYRLGLVLGRDADTRYRQAKLLVQYATYSSSKCLVEESRPTC